MNITEIAFESGFENVSHFSRVFKERFGVSPMAYRQNLPSPPDPQRQKIEPRSKARSVGFS